MDLFLDEISRFPMLTADEEIILGHQVQQALALEHLNRPLTASEQRQVKLGNRARKRFFEGNLRLVVYIAKRYARQTQHMDINDLIQEGGLGLMRAIDKYDPERGYKFSTYSYWWIKQAIGRAIQVSDRLIRRPSKVAELASKIPKAIHLFSVENGHLPSTSELAEYLQCNEAELQQLAERGGNVTSLDSVVMNTKDAVILDLIADPTSSDVDALDEQLDADMRVPQLLDLLQLLPAKDRDCVERRFGLNGYTPQTFQEIATSMGVTRERSRQILTRALNQIRLMAANQPSILSVECQRSAPVRANRQVQRLKPITAPIEQFA